MCKWLICISAYLLICTSDASAQTGPYVQPMQYRHYSFTGQVNIGNRILKITNPSAFLELGDSLNSKKGLLLPRGYTDSISSPARGLIIYDLRGQKIKWYNGSQWDSSGSSGGPGGPFLEIADSAAMLLNYRHWLANYQTKANLSTNVLLGASNTLYPSQLAVKTYVDNQLAGIGSGTFVPNTRTLTAGTWINTLGDLSTNRTVGIDTASLFNQTTGALRRKDSLTTTNLKGYVTRKILGDSMAIWRANSGILGQPTITYGLSSTSIDFPRTGLSTLNLSLIAGQPTSSSNIPFHNGTNLAWNSGLAIRASNVVTSGTDTLAPMSWVRANFGSGGGGSSSLTSTYIGFGNGSNALTGSVDLTYASNVVALEVPSSMQGGYNITHSGIGRLNFNYDQTTNLSQIQAANSPFRIDFGQSTTSDPSGPTDGMIWYNSTSDLFKIRANGVTEELNAPFYADDETTAGIGTSGDPLTVKKQMSITSDASGLKLSGDASTPGNNKVYGTDGSGTKGFQSVATINYTSGLSGQALAIGSTTAQIVNVIPFYENWFEGIVGQTDWTNAEISGKHVEVFREGKKQNPYSTTSGFSVSGTTITFYPELEDGETVQVIASPTAWWGTMSEGTGGLNYANFNSVTSVTESPTRTWNFNSTSATASQTTLSAAGDFTIRFEIPTAEAIVIGVDVSSAQEYFHSGDVIMDYDYGVFMGGGGGSNLFAQKLGDDLAVPNNVGSLSGKTHIELKRVSGVVSVGTSSNGSTFSTVYTYSGTNSSTFYLKASSGLTGSISNIKLTGFN